MPAAKKPRRVFDLRQYSADSPLQDGAQVFDNWLGVFSSLPRAQAAARRHWTEQFAGADPGDEPPFAYHKVREVGLDETDGPWRMHTLDRLGELRGSTGEDMEAPWAGQRAEDCKFGVGEIVAFHDGSYRLGIVLHPPVTTEQALRWKPEEMDRDTYLVGLASPTSCHDHEHPRQWDLWPPPEQPDAETVRRLRQRLCVNTQPPEPRCPTCGGNLAWCRPGDATHDLMRRYGLQPAGWCQVAETMLADAEAIVQQMVGVAGWTERRVWLADWCGRLMVEPRAEDKAVLEQLRRIRGDRQLPM